MRRATGGNEGDAGNFLCGRRRGAYRFSMSRPGRVLVLVALGVGWAAGAHAFKTVIVDAGHGGSDRGGIPGQQYSEKIYTLKVAAKVAALMKTNGYEVVMTRTSDTYVSLAERCRMANRRKSCIFVSIHFDSYRRKGANGITTYYTKSNSAALAARVHRRLIGALAPDTNRGVKRARFYVIRNTLCPSILVEGGYLTNVTSPYEAKKIITTKYQDELAAAIVRGLIDYDKS